MIVNISTCTATRNDVKNYFACTAPLAGYDFLKMCGDISILTSIVFCVVCSKACDVPRVPSFPFISLLPFFSLNPYLFPSFPVVPKSMPRRQVPANLFILFTQISSFLPNPSIFFLSFSGNNIYSSHFFLLGFQFLVDPRVREATEQRSSQRKNPVPNCH